jgi:hypothetical protein
LCKECTRPTLLRGVDRQSSKGSSSTRSECQKNFFQVLKLRRDSTVMRKDPARSVEVEETFQGSRIKNIKRSSAFAHRAIAKRNKRKENPLEGSEVEKLRRDKTLRTQVRPKFTGFTEETKVEVFGERKFSKFRKKRRSSGGSYIYCQMLHGYPIDIGSRRICMRFNPHMQRRGVARSFWHFGDLGFDIPIDERPGHFTVKTPKSQNATCLWRKNFGISAYRGFGYREVEGATFVVEDSQNHKSRSPEKVHIGEVSRKFLKGHFGISATARCKGENLKFLTHEIPKGFEPLD